MLEPAPPIANGHVGDPNDIHGHTICLNPENTDDPLPIDSCKIPDSEQLLNSIDTDSEPLGYQYFLCDVNIEYSPGGRLSSSDSNQHSFKMKYLPYMVKREACRYHQPRDEIGSNQSLSDCSLTEEDTTSSNSDSKIQPIDVTKTTCAFLGNSEYVPNHKFHQRRVVLEMISAKLSQSTTFSVPVTNNHTNLLAHSEKRPPIRRNLTARDHNDASPSLSTRPNGLSHENRSSNQNTTTNSQLTSSPMTSKKFVNYTILIKTAPGLDSHPAVIERRFSDFLQLYQGLKHQPHLASVIDRHVTFPKKVYMGNFSLTNIAERSILFAKLLDVCMTDTNILWSAPFISFLLDKELNEAHRLSLCGDPEDVQALIETVFFIEKKIYFKSLFHSKLGAGPKYSPNSPEPCNSDPKSCYSPSLPRTRIAIQSFSSDETISADSTGSTVNNSSSSTATRSSPLQSVSDLGDSSGGDLDGKLSSALSQRILVTFCILMLTYYRAENYSDLKMAIRDFSQLVSSQSYIESMVPTRHFTTLRACLLFLMNINRGDVIDDSQRFWLKQKLEDIDGAHTDTSGSPNGISKAEAVGSRRREGNSDTNVCRVTKADLASMLRDRNFCSFLNDKSLR